MPVLRGIGKLTELAAAPTGGFSAVVGTRVARTCLNSAALKNLNARISPILLQMRLITRFRRLTAETAARKVRGAEDAWNSRDPEKVSRVYSEDTHWRNRTEFLDGREAIKAFLNGTFCREGAAR